MDFDIRNLLTRRDRMQSFTRDTEAGRNFTDICRGEYDSAWHISHSAYMIFVSVGNANVFHTQFGVAGEVGINQDVMLASNFYTGMAKITNFQFKSPFLKYV